MPFPATVVMTPPAPGTNDADTLGVFVIVALTDAVALGVTLCAATPAPRNRAGASAAKTVSSRGVVCVILASGVQKPAAHTRGVARRRGYSR